MIQDFLKADDDAEEEDDDDDEDETFDADGGSDDASDADEGSGQILFPIRNPRTKNILDDSDDYSSIDESDSGSEEELGSSEESGKDWDELEAEAMRDDKNKERDVSFCYICKLQILYYHIQRDERGNRDRGGYGSSKKRKHGGGGMSSSKKQRR